MYTTKILLHTHTHIRARAYTYLYKYTSWRKDLGFILYNLSE